MTMTHFSYLEIGAVWPNTFFWQIEPTVFVILRRHSNDVGVYQLCPFVCWENKKMPPRWPHRETETCVNSQQISTHNTPLSCFITCTLLFFIFTPLSCFHNLYTPFFIFNPLVMFHNLYTPFFHLYPLVMFHNLYTAFLFLPPCHVS